MRTTTIGISGVLALSACLNAQAGVEVLGAAVPLSMVGDVNGDGVANADDAAIVQLNLNRPGGRAQGDVDGNGLVNANDLTLVTKNTDRSLPNAYFGKIADTAVAIPGGTGTFSQANSAVLDRSGNVGFMGSGSSNYGLYRWSSGATSKVADNATPVPSGTGNFRFFGLPSLSAGKLAFQGLGQGQSGLYSYSSGALTTVVNQNTPRPEGGNFTALGDAAVWNGSLSFVGLYGDARTAYSVAGGNALVPIASTATPIPNGKGTFLGIANPVSDGTNSFFIGTAIGQFGIYKKSGNTFTTLVDENTHIAGTDIKLTSLANLSVDGNNVSFTGTFGSAQGIFALGSSGGLKKVVDTSMDVPGGAGHFINFGVSSVGANSVAFVGIDQSNHSGIYAWINGELTRVIDNSISLGGKVISSLDMTRTAVAGNKIVFEADFTDGTSGIFSAAMIPTRLPGDINNDGKVNGADLAILQRNLGHAGNRAMGDLNGDGVVDFKDFQTIERNFGRGGPAPLLGDADGDGRVTKNDVRIVLANMGKFGGIPQGDANNDGRIDFADFQTVERNFGKSALAGDVNGDGKVDNADLKAFIADKAALVAVGDFNYNGKVDFSDYQLIEQNFGKATSAGDINGDGKVDNADLRAFLANYGRSNLITQGDTNGDGVLDASDFQAIELDYGRNLATIFEPFGPLNLGAVGDEAVAAATVGNVPEPTGMGVTVLAVGLLALRRRRGCDD